jgi:hypothetical protein
LKNAKLISYKKKSDFLTKMRKSDFLSCWYAVVYKKQWTAKNRKMAEKLYILIWKKQIRKFFIVFF